MPIEITALGIDFGNVSTTVIGVEEIPGGKPKFHVFSHIVAEKINGTAYYLKYYYDSILASHKYPANTDAEHLIPLLERNDIPIEELEEEQAPAAGTDPGIRIEGFEDHILVNRNADYGRLIVRSFFQQLFNELGNQSKYIFKPRSICYNLPIYPHVAERKIYHAAVHDALADYFGKPLENFCPAIYPASDALLSAVAYGLAVRPEEGTPILTVDGGGKTTGIAVAKVHYGKDGQLDLRTEDVLPPRSVEGGGVGIGLSMTLTIHSEVQRTGTYLRRAAVDAAKCALLGHTNPSGKTVPLTGSLSLVYNNSDAENNTSLLDLNNFPYCVNMLITNTKSHVVNYITEQEKLADFLATTQAEPLLLLTGGTCRVPMLRTALTQEVGAKILKLAAKRLTAVDLPDKPKAAFPGLVLDPLTIQDIKTTDAPLPIHKIATAYGAAYVAYRKLRNSEAMSGIEAGTKTRDLYSMGQKIKECNANTARLKKAADSMLKKLEIIFAKYKKLTRLEAELNKKEKKDSDDLKALAKLKADLEKLREALKDLISDTSFLDYLTETTDDTNK